jgi:hypothetical protein
VPAACLEKFRNEGPKVAVKITRFLADITKDEPDMFKAVRSGDMKVLTARREGQEAAIKNHLETDRKPCNALPEIMKV